IVRLLLAAGANVDARTEGDEGETPLHWAASSDDVDVADALIDGGADIECPGGSIGTPLDNPIGYGRCHLPPPPPPPAPRSHHQLSSPQPVLLGRVADLMAASPEPDEINAAFWQACSGAELRAAQYLLEHGADINATVDYASGTAVEQVSGVDTRRNVMT